MQVSSQAAERIRAISQCAHDRVHSHAKIEGFRLGRTSATAILRVIEFLRMKADEAKHSPNALKRNEPDALRRQAQLERFCSLRVWEMERAAWLLLDPEEYQRRRRKRMLLERGEVAELSSGKVVAVES